MKVVPYEHKAKYIQALQCASVADAFILHEKFLAETDKWLKKLIATRLLSYEGLDPLMIDNNKLKDACRCQIEP